MPFTVPKPQRFGSFDATIQVLEGACALAPIAQALQLEPPVVWFDSAREHPVTGRWSILGADPWLTLIARGDRIECRTAATSLHWRMSPLEALRAVLKRYRVSAALTPQSRMLGLMGCLSYEANRWIERLPEPQAGSDLPEMIWYGMKQVWLVDHHEKRTWLMSLVDPHMPKALARHAAGQALEKMRDLTQTPKVVFPSPTAERFVETALSATSTQTEFERSVDAVLAFIRAGDIYQANLSQRFTASWESSAWPLYETLRAINPSPFACWFSSDELTVVSCSPERLVRVQEGWIDTRPIAGTRPRGATPADDAFNGLELLLSEKEKAEHVMLVDLARNDLGRVCQPGSVRVNEFMALETYSHVIHIVSEVIGRLKAGVDSVDVIRALFPGGTITGCPKVRCMEILRKLEPVARGLYTGSLGFIGFDGTMDLNIAIRTIVIRSRQLSFHVGAGIVADSDPAREYQETLDKGRALCDAINRVPRAHPMDSHAYH